MNKKYIVIEEQNQADFRVTTFNTLAEAYKYVLEKPVLRKIYKEVEVKITEVKE
jgi:hypothetical protein